MAFTFKNRRLGYDNIANGSTAGLERHQVGGGGIETTRETLSTLNTSDIGTNTSNIANRPLELDLPTPSSDNQNTSEPSTNTTQGYTSTTSWTSVFPERLG